MRLFERACRGPIEDRADLGTETIEELRHQCKTKQCRALLDDAQDEFDLARVGSCSQAVDSLVTGWRLVGRAEKMSKPKGKKR